MNYNKMVPSVHDRVAVMRRVGGPVRAAKRRGEEKSYSRARKHQTLTPTREQMLAGQLPHKGTASCRSQS